MQSHVAETDDIWNGETEKLWMGFKCLVLSWLKNSDTYRVGEYRGGRKGRNKNKKKKTKTEKHPQVG